MKFRLFLLVLLLAITPLTHAGIFDLPALTAEEQQVLQQVQTVMQIESLQAHRVSALSASSETLLRLGHSFREGTDGVEQEYPSATLFYEQVLVKEPGSTVATQAQEALWETQDRQGILNEHMGSAEGRGHITHAYARGEHGVVKDAARAIYHGKIALQMDPKQELALLELAQIAFSDQQYQDVDAAKVYVTRLAPLVNPDCDKKYQALRTLLETQWPEFARTLEWGTQVPEKNCWL